jgi:hypothetical protein
MRSKIALRVVTLALGAAFVSTPALAQQYLGTPQSPGIGPNGDPRYDAGGSSPSLSSGQPPYGQASGLYNQAPGISAPGDQGTAADCAARFRSYDPASGTYLGFDGRRRPCP